MIHTGKRTAGIAFLKLSDGNVTRLAVYLVATAIKSGHFVIDDTIVFDLNLNGA